MLAATTAACTSSGSSATPPASTSAGVPSTGASSPGARATTDPLARYYRQKLHWSSCGGAFSCASLTVPVDYTKPAGATMKVAVIRRKSSGSHHGSLIINPGGPGASGLDYERSSAGDYAAVTDHFDLVSFDPRGVGESRPIRCVSSSVLDAYVHTDPTPDTPAEHAAVVTGARQFAAACAARNGAYLSHVGTIDAARDMDVLRAALGDAKLTYVGKSYGTYMGAKYAQLFPTHIRALVLDGALDPSQSTSAENRVQAIGFETDLRDFLADCARHSCALGGSQQAATQGLDQLAQQVDAHPVAGGSGRTVGPGEFFEGLALGLYSPSFWPALRTGLARLQNGDGSVMLQLSDALTDRQSNGSYSNLVESNTAINCIDRPSSRDVADYDRDAKAFAAASPHFGTAIAYGTLPCAFWPVPPVEAAHSVHATGAPPIVVIGTTRDPATPYVWAQALAHQLASGVLVTYDGDGHTAYARGSRCVDDAVNAYLARLVVPRQGLRCS